MKYWKCPKCKREREYHGEIIKICYVCQEQMKIINEKEKLL